MKSSDFGFIKCSSCGCDIGWINGWANALCCTCYSELIEKEKEEIKELEK